MFNRVLIANRGEIALRVIRTCREMGIGTVAVYSDADASAAHVAAADRAVRIGPAPASESYLRAGAIIDAARGEGAEAVHPGYGFLAENPEFAAACADAGLVFIGPPPDAIAAMGSKIEARRLMQRAGVAVVPGETPQDQTTEAIASGALGVGLPVLVKPAAGGGGIGMRAVRAPDDLRPAVEAARRDAIAAFGDGTLYVERLLERPRHIEIQIFADAHGGVMHLFERECSLQRRHQKIVEESPSPALTPALRARMGEAAIAAARAAGYRNAGTVEFLLDTSSGEARFFFLEMNTRLQVEHPVTEVLLGCDLVRAQLAVAAGEPLPWRPDDLSPRGHAIECRVYAEDPARDFLPQAGEILAWRAPEGPGVRVDAGIREGDTVSVHYDPLLAKIVVGADTREAALARAGRALGELVLLGIRTNVPFLQRILVHPDVRSGRIDTGLIDRDLTQLLPSEVPDEIAAAAAAAAISRISGAPSPAPGAGARGSTATYDPWVRLGGRRL